MAWPKLKTTAFATAAILLATGIAVIFTTSPTGIISRVGLRLPVGKGTPATSLGERHGLILASDGSLWSWGSDFLRVARPRVGECPVANSLVPHRL